jgi:hypothetical protein
MNSVVEPLEAGLSDIGVDLPREDLLRFGNWVAATAVFKTTQHNVHDTTRDLRPFSNVRKLPLPFDSNSGLPDEYIDITREIYTKAMAPFGGYLGLDLDLLPTRYAAEAHARKPGDGQGEGHVDYYSSLNVYFSNNEGGELVISKNPNVRSIADIAGDAYRVTPRLGKIVLFNGVFMPHYVEEPTDDTPRINLVLAYHHDKENADVRHPRHYPYQ